MSNVIDIERLAEMPITDEFIKMLFTLKEVNHDIKIEKFEESLCISYGKHDYCRIDKNGIFQCYDCGESSPVFDIFGVVRYIDKYLNGGKSDVEKLVQDIHDSIHIGIVQVDDTDNVMFGTVKKLAEKYL